MARLFLDKDPQKSTLPFAKILPKIFFRKFQPQNVYLALLPKRVRGLLRGQFSVLLFRTGEPTAKVARAMDQ